MENKTSATNTFVRLNTGETGILKYELNGSCYVLINGEYRVVPSEDVTYISEEDVIKEKKQEPSLLVVSLSDISEKCEIPFMEIITIDFEEQILRIKAGLMFKEINFSAEIFDIIDDILYKLMNKVKIGEWTDFKAHDRANKEGQKYSFYCGFKNGDEIEFEGDYEYKNVPDNWNEFINLIRYVIEDTYYYSNLATSEQYQNQKVKRYTYCLVTIDNKSEIWYISPTENIMADELVVVPDEEEIERVAKVLRVIQVTSKTAPAPIRKTKKILYSINDIDMLTPAEWQNRLNKNIEIEDYNGNIIKGKLIEIEKLVGPLSLAVIFITIKDGKEKFFIPEYVIRKIKK